MSISLKITRLRTQSIKKTIDNVTKDIEREVIDETKKAMLVLHSSAVKIVQTKSPGTSMVRYGPKGTGKRTVTAARAGESPNTDTGHLIGGIGFNFQLLTTGASARVGTNVKYGKYLELGTSQMGAHPWLSTAWIQNRDRLIKNYSAEIKSSIKRNGV